MELMKTKDYGIFKFKSDNRKDIAQAHVDFVKESIQTHNMLQFRPILVNTDYEVLDGQHRLLAAKALGVDIYYQVMEKSDNRDILLMNVVKKWSFADYLNYYCKNGYAEYQKLEKFIKETGLELRVAVRITNKSTTTAGFVNFREGKYKFSTLTSDEDVLICFETINVIVRTNGTTLSAYTKSYKFWRAMICLVQHPDFETDKWFTNLNKLAVRFGVRASSKDYMRLFQNIYNYHNKRKISIFEEETFQEDDQ